VKFPILFILFVCLSDALGQSRTSLYVATTGNDSNSGTLTSPWRTIQHAADAARAGSTVNVRGGVYEELVSVNASGNASEGYITFRSYPGETAILEAEHFTPAGKAASPLFTTRAM
jgi:pectin methylesterase-like acyl-CoA thioesterase